MNTLLYVDLGCELMDGCKDGETVNLVAAERCLNFYLCFCAFMGCALNTEVVMNFII